MSEKELTQGNASNQFQFETLNQLIGGLKGFTKRIAAKILNSGFVEELKNIQNSYDVEAANDAVKKLLEIAAQRALNDIRRKVMIIPVIITGIAAVLAIIITLAAGGNVMIPVIVTVILIVMIWFITNKIFKLIARNISGIIFNAIESKKVYHE